MKESHAKDIVSDIDKVLDSETDRSAELHGVIEQEWADKLQALHDYSFLVEFRVGCGEMTHQESIEAFESFLAFLVGG